MITEIEISNFKAIGEPVTIPIRPISLLFGANSCGKSSILECLQMLSQTLGRRSFIPDGQFKEYVHLHDTSKVIRIVFTDNLDEKELFYHLFDTSDDDYVLNQTAFIMRAILKPYEIYRIAFSFKENEHSISFLSKIEIYLGEEDSPVLSSVFNSEDIFNSFQYNLEHSFWDKYWRNFALLTYFSLLRSSAEEEHEFTKKFVKKKFKSSLSEEKNLIRLIRLLKDVEVETISREEATKYFYDIVNLKPDSLSEEKFEEIITALQKNSLSSAVTDNIIAYFVRLPGYDDMSEDECSEELGRVEKDILQLINCRDEYLRLYEDDLHGGVAQLDWPWIPSKLDVYSAQELFRKRYQYDSITEEIEYSTSYRPNSFNPGALLLLMANNVKEFLSHPNFSYIGPLREKPERYYLPESHSYAVVQKLSQDASLLRLLNKEFQHLQSRYQIEIVPLSNADTSLGTAFVAQLIDPKTGLRTSIKDVGFGYSQLLPIILESLNRYESQLVIEQPELHLHPAMQAELGDMFIRAAGDRSVEFKERINHLFSGRNKFLLETHSEHLLLRILRRIRETTDNELPEDVPEIKTNDIAVLYVQNGERGAEVTHIPVTEDGEFACSWPKGFFPERAKELF